MTAFMAILNRTDGLFIIGGGSGNNSLFRTMTIYLAEWWTPTLIQDRRSGVFAWKTARERSYRPPTIPEKARIGEVWQTQTVTDVAV